MEAGPEGKSVQPGSAAFCEISAIQKCSNPSHTYIRYRHHICKIHFEKVYQRYLHVKCWTSW